MSDLRYRSLMAICVVCCLNFVVFFAVAVKIGGDAINGKIVDGHFYLANHEKLTEVSEAVFTYSLWHVRSLFITHPLAILTGYLMKMEQRERRRLTGLPPYEQTRTL
jgi:ABC-type maltose transport system permease subunit